MPSDMQKEKVMHKLHATFAIAALALAMGCGSAAAEPSRNGAQNARCPVGYWLLEPVCLNEDSGDVVNANPAPTKPASFELGCAPGYWRQGALCLSPATGDVELADEKRWPAERRAS
jgi:hypothetical protein